MVMIYESIATYLDSRCSTDMQRIAVLKEVLKQLDTAILDAATKGAIREYSLDSGQSKVETKYRSIKEMVNGMIGLEGYITMLQNRNNKTRNIRLCPAQSPSRRLY